MNFITILSLFNKLLSGGAVIEEVIKDGFAIANQFIGDGTHKTTLQMWEQKLIEDKELAAQTLMSLGKSLQKVGEFLQSVQPRQTEPVVITTRPLSALTQLKPKDMVLPEKEVDAIKPLFDAPTIATLTQSIPQPAEVAVLAPQPIGEASTPLQNP